MITLYPLHHASFYRIASATTVYCKCCQRNRSPMWLAANPQDVACSEKCPCRWAWHMQSIRANVAIFAKEDAAMQHHIVSHTPTHAAKLRYCKEHYRLLLQSRVGLSPTKRSSDIHNLGLGLHPLLSSDLRFGSICVWFVFSIAELF